MKYLMFLIILSFSGLAHAQGVDFKLVNVKTKTYSSIPGVCWIHLEAKNNTEYNITRLKVDAILKESDGTIISKEPMSFTRLKKGKQTVDESSSMDIGICNDLKQIELEITVVDIDSERTIKNDIISVIDSGKRSSAVESITVK